MDQQHGRERIFGLDLMRATAILLVVYMHADDLLDVWWPRNTGLSGIDGVDLFFVLSGYLIGGILLRSFAHGERPWYRRLADFWQRRWLRTLPNYYLFLVVNIALVHFGLAPGLLNSNVLAYFMFLQNVHIPLDLFFWESWSLVIEEWFYLLFPVLLLIASAMVGRMERGYVAAVLFMITVSTLLRFRMSGQLDDMVNAGLFPQAMLDDLRLSDLFLRKLVIHRLDGIGFGVLAAWVHRQHGVAWRRCRIPAFIVGLVGLSIAAHYHGASHRWFSGTWYFTCSAVSMAMLLPLLSTWRSAGVWGRPVTFISVVSYALYLVHLPLRDLCMPLFTGLSAPMTLLGYGAYWALAIAVAALVYRYWERPFLLLRERISSRWAVAGRSA